MKNDEISAAATEAEVKAKGWLAKAKTTVVNAWKWFWARSWKTKAAIGVGAVVALIVICGGTPSRQSVASLVESDAYTKAETESLISAGNTATLQAAIGHSATASQFNELEAQVHQMKVELDAVEGRLSTPTKAPITTGSIPTRKKKPAPVKASSSWFGIEP